MGLREKIVEAASECWSPDGTDFYTGMLADKILDIPEIKAGLVAKIELDALKLALLQSQVERPGNVWQPIIPE
jgi:hypothetical protein